MFYDHAETIRHVAPEDARHVDNMLATLDAYARSEGRSSLGRFLSALVIGDLVEAVCHADDTNVKYLRQFVKYIYNQLPGTHVCLASGALAVVRKAMDKGQRNEKPLTRADVEHAAREFAQAIARAICA